MSIMKRIFYGFVLILAGFPMLFAQAPDPTVQLLKELKSKNPEKRSAALMALADLGPKAAPAIPALAEILPGFDEEQRLLATLALGKIGKASLPAALKLLDHEDETTRYYAVWTLGIIGKDAQADALRLLSTFEKDEDEEVRVKAAYALARIAPDSREVLAAFSKVAVNQEIPPGERQGVIEELRYFGPAALEPLVKALEDPGGHPKAMESLRHLLNENKNVVFAKMVSAHLERMLASASNGPNGSLAGDGLTFILARHGEKLLANLEPKLRDQNVENRKRAVWVLSQVSAYLHPENSDLARKATKRLLPFFTDPNESIRGTALSLAVVNDETQPAFMELMLDDDPTTRLNVYAKFQSQGLDPTPMLRAKMKAAKGDEKIRYACVLFSLTRDPNLGDMLWTDLRHKDAAVRHRIACTLANLQFPVRDVKKERQLAQVLIDGLKSDNVDRRVQAGTALLAVQAVLRDHMPALLDRLDDPSPGVRSVLLRSLQAHIDADPKMSLKKILPLLEDGDELVRFAAVTALLPLRKQCVAELARRTEKDPSSQVWELVCQQLAHAGKDGKEAVPALMRAAQDAERWAAANAALAEIAPDETFAPLLEMQIKRDERLSKAINYPKEVYHDRGKLIDKLLKDGKAAEHARRRDVVYALQTVVPMLPLMERVKIVQSLSPLLTSQLAVVEKELTSKDAKTRIEAATTLVALRDGSIGLEMFVFQLPAGKDTELLFKHQALQAERFEKLIRLARIDPELQVRRQGRKAEALNAYIPGVFLPGKFGR
jgi:HEAT repeat protein